MPESRPEILPEHLRSKIDSIVRAIEPEVRAARHEFHAHPELSWKEVETSRRIESQLRKIPGLEITTGIAETGITALLRGRGAGPTVALRADMDALPVTEKTGLTYASKNEGVMHACGHDGHIAVMLGAAMALSKIREDIPGAVRFIFQPAEEGGAGGDAMCKAGVLKDVDAVFALHGWPEAPLGKIVVSSGAMLASTSEIFISVSGKGSHAAYPHRGTDQILIGARIIEALQGIIAREINPCQTAVLSMTTFHGGRATNIIPESIELSGTLRTLDLETRDFCATRIVAIAESIAKLHGASAKVEVRHGYPVTKNHEKEAAFVASTARAVLGADAVAPFLAPSMGAEDFSYYLLEKPGAYFFLGVNDGRTGGYPPLHHPAYDFNDQALAHGVRMMGNLAVHYR